jgi:hypothetical protein
MTRDWLSGLGTKISELRAAGRVSRGLRLVAAAGLALGLGHGVAIAQGAPGAPPPPPAAPAPGAPAAPATPGGAPGGADLGLSRQVDIPPADQMTQAEADLSRMEQARDQVRRQLMEARAQRDVVKTLCLNDKLSQLNVAISSAQERRDALAAAVKTNDRDLATHEFTIMTVLRQRTDQLQAEANQCLGEEIGRPDEKASVKMTIDKDLPQEDPSDYPSFTISQEPPTCASCYL